MSDERPFDYPGSSQGEPDYDYDYSFTYVNPWTADTLEMYGTLNPPTDEATLKVADLLHAYTGEQVAAVTDGGHYTGWHVQGGSEYTLLADDMGGPAMLTVMECGTGGRQRVLYQHTFDSWLALAQAAGSVRLRR